MRITIFSRVSALVSVCVLSTQAATAAPAYTLDSISAGKSASSPTSSPFTPTRLSHSSTKRGLPPPPGLVPPSLTLNINLNPDPPRKPNVLTPMVLRPEGSHLQYSRSGIAESLDSDLATKDIKDPSATVDVVAEQPAQGYPGGPGGGAGGDGHDSNNRNQRPGAVVLDPKIQELVLRCQTERLSSVPDSFPHEVGVVSLFRETSYRVEVGTLKGCGCINLQSPTVIESFVGSRNHSFSFYTTDDCEGEPYFQRFKQHFDVEPTSIARSIRIVQGILEPLPKEGSNKMG